MTTIGYAVLQIIPSLDGLSEAVDKQLGGLKGEGRAAGKALSDGIASGVDAAAAKVEQASKRVEAARNKEADAAGKVKTAEAQLESLREKGVKDAGRLTAAEEKVAKAKRDHETASKNLVRSTKDEERATEQLTQAQKRAASATDNAADSSRRFAQGLSGFKSSISDALGGLDGLGDSMRGFGDVAGADLGSGVLDGISGPLAALGTKVGPIGAALAGATVLGFSFGKELVDQIDAGLATLATQDLVQARLGIDDETMRRIARESGIQYVEGWGSTVEDNMRATQLAMQSGLLDPKASEDQIGEVIGQLQALATVMDVDVSEAARGAGKLLITGVADSATHAFDLLTAGTQNGLDLTGDLIDTMEEYATKFRDVGLSGEESLGLINQLLEGGARNTDLAADALKEFSLKVIDGTESTRAAFTDLGLNADDLARRFAAGGEQAHDAFGLVLDRLNAIQDPLLRSQVGVALFGTKWEDMGDAVRRANLPTAVESLGRVDGASKAAANKVGEHASSWDRLARNIKQSFDNYQTGLAQSGLGEFLGSTVPDFLNDRLFGEEMPALPPPAPGQTLGESGLLGAPPAPRVQGPGIRQPVPVPSESALPPGIGFGTGPAVLDPRIRARPPGRAGGGPISGPGGPTSDDVLLWGSNGEHVWTAAEVDAAGGHDSLYRLRAAVLAGGKVHGYKGGGAIGGNSPDLASLAEKFARTMDPAGYAMGGFSPKAFDCSGFVSAVANVATGRDPFSSRMSTTTAGPWLESLGFKSGHGGSGDLRVGWWDKGGGANGHMAGTFPDGTNFESNGSQGVVIGGKTGAGSSQFTDHAYLPGELLGGNLDGLGSAVLDSIDLGRDAVTDSRSGSGVSTATSAAEGGSSGVTVPSSLSGLSRVALDSLGAGVGTTKSGSDLSLFGQAAGSAVGDQVSSALGVFGVTDSPGWLKAASMFVGGLKVGGNDPSGESDGSLFDGSNMFSWGQGEGASAAPYAATARPWQLPEVDHGSRAGQAPGPTGPTQVVNWTINARDTEDAFIRAQRMMNERVAAKLTRF